MTKFGLFLDYATIMVAGPFISLYTLLDLWEGDFDEKLIDTYTVPVYALLFAASYFFTYLFGTYYTAYIGPLFSVLTLYGTQAKYSPTTDYTFMWLATGMFFLSLFVFM